MFHLRSNCKDSQLRKKLDDRDFPCQHIQLFHELKPEMQTILKNISSENKKKSFASLSYNWSVPKFLVSGQTLVSYGQKTIFQEFGPLKQTLGKDDLSMPIFPPSGDFFGNFWIPTSSVCIGENMYQFSSGLVALENV